MAKQQKKKAKPAVRSRRAAATKKKHDSEEAEVKQTVEEQLADLKARIEHLENSTGIRKE